jgi:predicted unusual protein kinase regulating ubiquinone biosynthesis (AarF/ABC1/UbiB family)
MPLQDDSVPRGRIRRTMPLAGFTARAAGGRLVAGLRERTGDDGAVDRFHERTAERYTELLGHSKGVLMKAGQILSMVDVSAIGTGEFSPYQKALTRLQADAPPMDAALAKGALRADIGRSTDEVFAEFTEEPIAAASIGQVHKAVLHDGRQVAVKIQYPGAAEAIRDDLANTELLTTLFRFGTSAARTTMPDMREAVREISARIAEEIDYRHEAANINAFSDLYRDHPFIRIPEVISEASADRVLTMTYLDGMNWAAAQQADQDLKDSWGEVIYRFSLGSWRHGNLFHADPHPGNYCFGVDGTVGFVDFGCVTVIPERQRQRIVGIVRGLVEGRKLDLRDLMVESGFFAHESTLTADQAYEWWAGYLPELVGPQPVTYSQDIPQRAVRSLLDVRDADHPVRRMSPPNDVALLPRINLSMSAVLAALGATIHVQSIGNDLDGAAEPTTPLGKQHGAWVRQRGLPYGTQPHDHP